MMGGHAWKGRGVLGHEERSGKADLSMSWSGGGFVGGRLGHYGEEIGKVGEGLSLGGVKRRKWQGRGGMLECMDQIMGSGEG